MSSSLVQFSVDSGVAHLRLTRVAKRNALTRAFISEIARHVDQAAKDDRVRLLVISADGPVFCAGMDLGEMQDRAKQPDAKDQWRTDTQVYRDLLVAVLQFPQPTLAVVQGPALAGGLGLVLACDMVLAAESARFALPEPKRGISAAVVAPLLIYRIGVGRATYVLLSGENVSAQDALRMGLCHEVVADAALATRNEELTRSILTGAQQALALTKRHVLETAAGDLVAQLDASREISATARETGDAREGLTAFLEKRTPRWFPEGK